MGALAYANLKASDGTTSTAALGQTFEIKGATWVYAKAAAALTAGQLCYLDNSFNAALATPALLTTTKPTYVVIPQFDFASGEYGWFAAGPFFLREDDVTTFKVISKIAAQNVVMYGVAATPGSVDDAVAAPIIQGLFLSAAQAVNDALTPCIATRRLATTS